MIKPPDSAPALRALVAQLRDLIDEHSGDRVMQAWQDEANAALDALDAALGPQAPREDTI